MTKKNNKFKLRQETSDKYSMQKPLHPRGRLKQKVQGHLIVVVHFPGKRKSKRRSKNPQRNPPNRKISFMHKKTEKAKKTKGITKKRSCLLRYSARIS